MVEIRVMASGGLSTFQVIETSPRREFKLSMDDSIPISEKSGPKGVWEFVGRALRLPDEEMNSVIFLNPEGTQYIPDIYKAWLDEKQKSS